MKELEKNSNIGDLKEYCKALENTVYNFENIFTIFSRSTIENGLELKNIKNEDMKEISSYMKVIDSGNNNLGKMQTQTTDFALSFSNFTPYKNIKQILAHIEKKRMALRENIFKIMEKTAKIKSIYDSYADGNIEIDELKQIEIAMLKTSISDIRVYIEGAIKEIYSLQQGYKGICKKFNIDETNWSEEELEKAELKEHVMQAFYKAYLEFVSCKQISTGVLEYFTKLGIDPMNASTFVIKFIEKRDMENTNSFNEYNKNTLGMINEFKGKIELAQKTNDKLTYSAFIKKVNEEVTKLEFVPYSNQKIVSFLEEMWKKHKEIVKNNLMKKGFNSEGYYKEILNK